MVLKGPNTPPGEPAGIAGRYLARFATPVPYTGKTLGPPKRHLKNVTLFVGEVT